MIKVIAKALNLTSRHSELAIISPSLVNPRTKIGNQGTSTKTPDIAPCTNKYEQSPSGQPGRPVLSASRNAARTIESTLDGKRMLHVAMLEKHPYTSQSFIPMGSDDQLAYIVVVADGHASDLRPDLNTVRAYKVSGDVGVCYGANLWHAPMAVVGKAMDFGIFQYMNGVEEEDCTVFHLETPIKIVF